MMHMQVPPAIVIDARNGDRTTLRRWWRAAVEMVAARYSVAEDDVYAMSRQREVTFARMRAMAAIRLATACSYPSLARVIGCNHTTILEAVRRVIDEPDVATLADELTRHLVRGWDAIPPWQAVALANGWHPPSECERRRDEHGGGEL